MAKQEIRVEPAKKHLGSPGAAHPAVPRALADVFALLGASLKVERNAEIYGEAEEAEFAYLVVRGVVRTHKLLCDGRRQINAFHFPGDVFGLESAGEHRFTAEAVCNTTVRFVKRSAVMALAARDSEVANALWMTAADELRQAHEHMLLLGRKNAQERVAAFLLEAAKRAHHSDTVDLPMSRLDIADYLGLTIETVSRTLTLLENAAAIELPSTRRVHLCNKAALSRLNA